MSVFFVFTVKCALLSSTCCFSYRTT